MSVRGCAPAVWLAALDAELLERIVGFVEDVEDLASLNATSRLFRGAPSSRSLVESVLRARFGHLLPKHVDTGPKATRLLLEVGRVWRGAQRHALVAAVSDDCMQQRMSALVGASGALYTCGERVLFEDEEEEEADEERERRSASFAALGHGESEEAPGELKPRRVAALGDARITAVAAGSHHLLALSDAGAVYACGRNASGQLGLGTDVEEVPTPTRIDELRDEHVVCISSRNVHCLALTATGRVHSWGHNGFGRLGYAVDRRQLVPTLVEGLAHARIAGISAGGAHSLALCTSGAVYSFGYGRSGELGRGDNAHQLTPKRIEALAAVRAVHVSAGMSHSVVVDEAGCAHSFGRGDEGQLGHGDRVRQNVPRRIEALAGVRTVRASAGSYATALLDAEGGMHTCGGYDLLGHGDEAGGLTVPIRVEALGGEFVVGVFMGYRNSCATTSNRQVYVWGHLSAALGDGRSALNPEEGVDVPQQLMLCEAGVISS